MHSIFISGISSGLGKGLALFYAQKGIHVYGVSRRLIDYKHELIHHLQLDLTQYAEMESKLYSFLPQEIDLVVLNAGVLGNMSSMLEANLSEMKSVMETNLWSQTQLLNCLLKKNKVQSVIGISSGAAINGNVGWSGYALSKAAFNMCIQLYAKEFPQTHFIAFAPGLVDTAMQDYLCGEVKVSDYPSVEKLHHARGTDSMPTPEEFAPKFDAVLERIQKLDSGSFVDIRNL